MYYPQPAWQSSDVDTYFSQVMGTAKEPVTGYRRSGRGYPDIALAGTAYLISIGGAWFSVSGTSASCPVFAGMISIINGARLAANMSPVGWLNPTLYRKKLEFTNDIVFGKNNCGVGQQVPCCLEGFHAAPGWDPTTGLGSVNFKLLQKFLLGIPNLAKPPTKAPSSRPTGSPTRTSSPSEKRTATPTTKPSATPAPSKTTATPTTKPSATSGPSKTTATPTMKPSATSAPLKATASPTKTVSATLAPSKTTASPTKMVSPNLEPPKTTASPTKNPTTAKPQSTIKPTAKNF
jgi:hypothetical protein